jgi:ABC-2 type transport system permease protein
MTALLITEAHRALSRTLVRVLVLFALLVSVVGSVLSFVNTTASGRDAAGHVPLRIVELWSPQQEEGVLLVVYLLLVLGAVVGAASVIGAEWRYGTIGSLLTFEPRRLRVGAAKLIATAVTAMAIALGLVLALLVILLPTLVLHGDAAGADGAWWVGAAFGLGRALLLVGFGAAIAGAIALLTRSTVAVIVAFFVYLQFVERLLVAWKPWLGNWSLTENVGSFLTWGALGGGDYATPGPGSAAIHLGLYLSVAVAIALASFHRRDVAGAS